MVSAKRRLHIRDLGRTRRNKNNADFVSGKPCLGHCTLAGQLGSNFYWRQDRKQVINQIWKTDADQADNRRTGRADKWPLFLMRIDIFPGGLGDKLCGSTDFKDIIKSEVNKRRQQDIHIIQIIELGIHGRRRKCHSVSVIVENIQ